MSSRFFLDTPPHADLATLTDAEAHHLLHVMRAKVGDAITLFDGTGVEYVAEITRLARSSVEARVVATQEVERELPREVVIGVALPKGDRQRWLVEKLVELGVARCIPLVTRRGVAQPEGGTLEKLRRAVIEASKQCGRNRLLTIDSPLEWSQFVAAAPSDSLRFVAHPPQLWPASLESAGATAIELGTELATNPSRRCWFAVGPEGGFADDEIKDAIAATWRPIGLGSRILRVETAAMALASLAAANTVE
jgi:16S rRNA (uracil1498-N3)-methyltransferase